MACMKRSTRDRSITQRYTSRLRNKKTRKKRYQQIWEMFKTLYGVTSRRTLVKFCSKSVNLPHEIYEIYVKSRQIHKYHEWSLLRDSFRNWPSCSDTQEVEDRITYQAVPSWWSFAQELAS
jgi:hypothetical protein